MIGLRAIAGVLLPISILIGSSLAVSGSGVEKPALPELISVVAADRNVQSAQGRDIVSPDAAVVLAHPQEEPALAANETGQPLSSGSGLSQTEASTAPLASAAQEVLAQNAGTSPRPVDTITASKAWAQIKTNSCKVFNNVWGAPAGEDFVSSVYVRPEGALGWDWDRPAPKIGAGKSCPEPLYPDVRIGGSPWEKSESAQFPIRLGDTRKLTLDVSYQYLQPPTGVFDLAYDIFLVDSPRTSQTPTLKAEVMIWLNGTAKQPARTFKGNYSDGNHTYDLYSWVMKDGRLYYSFLLKAPPETTGHVAVNAKKLMDNLNLETGWYIHGIELGNEVWNGSGKIEITHLSADLNGSQS
jgi:hypothetical protein